MTNQNQLSNLIGENRLVQLVDVCLTKFTANGPSFHVYDLVGVIKDADTNEGHDYIVLNSRPLNHQIPLVGMTCGVSLVMDNSNGKVLYRNPKVTQALHETSMLNVTQMQEIAKHGVFYE